MKPDADLSPYKVLILDEASKLNPQQAETIRQYVKNGGKLLALYSGCQNLEDVLGITIESKTLPEGYNAAYIAPAAEPVWNSIARTPLVVSGNDSCYLVKLNGGETLAKLMLPFDTFPKTPGLFGVNAPSQVQTDYPAIVRHKYGKGEAIFVSAAVAREIENTQKTADYSAAYHKRLIANLVGLLGGTELIKTNAPTQVEVNLARKDMKYLVHLTDCSAALGNKYSGDVSDLPLLTMKVSIPVDRLGSARKVRLVPENTEVPAVEHDGRLEWDAQVKLHSIYEIF